VLSPKCAPLLSTSALSTQHSFLSSLLNEQEQQLQHAIRTLEGYADLLGEAVVQTALLALREKSGQLATRHEKRARRKQITVMFADLAGFTAMSEKMDAEDVTHIINELWQRLDKVIVQQEGYIDKHMGDGVMALWGVQHAREDDPERAIRAGLAMQAELRDWCNRHPRYAHLRLRVGIHTGLALLGVIGTLGEYTAIGDTVNVASRLEEAAVNGHLFISLETYRHVRGLFEVVVQEPLHLKGKQEPMEVYDVKGVNPHAFHISTRGVEGIETRTVGREQEQAHLRHFWEQFKNRTHLHMVVLTGEAGIGKSRLLTDFQTWLAQEPAAPLVLQARATQTMMGEPYALVRDLLAGALLRGQGESQSARLYHLLAQFIPTHTAEKAQQMATLLGFEGGQEETNPAPAFDVVGELMAAVLQQYPVLFYLEDIHWADDGSLDLLAHVGRVCQQLPLFVVATTRPSLFGRRRLWPGLSSYLTQIDLRPLSATHSRALVDDLLRHVEQIPDTLYNLVLGMSGGNPYYIEEIIRKLIEDEIVVVSRNAWEVRAERLSRMHIPTTLVGTLQARLDNLPSPELVVLRKAAVVGRLFWDTAVAALYIPSVDEPNGVHHLIHVQQLLAALCQREIITELGTSALNGATEYVFKHHMLHEVAYDTVLRSERKLYHAQVAQWLMQHTAVQPHFAMLIAEHWEQAEDPAQAGMWYWQAGEQAVSQSALPEALDYLSKALLLTEDEGYAQQFDILLCRELVYHKLGQLTAQRRDLHQLQKLALFLGDNGRQATLAGRMAEYRL
jgi:class 3 adenylate cyclase